MNRNDAGWVIIQLMLHHTLCPRFVAYVMYISAQSEKKYLYKELIIETREVCFRGLIVPPGAK